MFSLTFEFACYSAGRKTCKFFSSFVWQMLFTGSCLFEWFKLGFFFAIHIFPVIEYLYMHKCICVLNITSFQHKYYHLISIVRIYNFLFLFPFFTISISVHLWFLFVFCLCSNVNTVIICSLSSFKVFSIKYPLSLLYLIIVYMITQFFVPLLYCHHAPNGTFFIYKGKNSAIVTNWFFFISFSSKIIVLLLKIVLGITIEAVLLFLIWK